MRPRSLLLLCVVFTLVPFASARSQDSARPGDIRAISASEFTVLLEQTRGEIILVNLWATWCAPCLREIPELLRLRDAYANSGFRLIAVAMDDPLDLEAKVLPFRDKHFPDWETFHRSEVEMDALVSVVDPGWNEVLPTSYLIDRTGQVAKTLFGGKSYEAFEAALLEIL